jgi:putative mRNA 3-end processing factor
MMPSCSTLGMAALLTRRVPGESVRESSKTSAREGVSPWRELARAMAAPVAGSSPARATFRSPDASEAFVSGASVSAVEVRPAGLYCAAGDFYVDPAGSVERALLTHAHADHAFAGSASYLCASPGVAIAQHRLQGAAVAGLPYGEVRRIGGANVSFHPAGHVLGSAQIRIEVGGAVTVVAGDYKRAADPTTPAFEPLRCEVFVTETTFGLPVFTWPEASTVVDELIAAWQAERAAGAVFLVYGYALGKAQRLLALLADHPSRPPEPVCVHGAIANINQLYENEGVRLAPWEALGDRKGAALAGRLVLAPPHTRGSAWVRRFPGARTALLSGFCRIRGERRRANVDRGLVLSDHADYDALHRTVRETEATHVLTTGPHADTFARDLHERGLSAEAVTTSFVGEGDA